MAVTINDRNLFVKLGDCFIAPDYTISQVTNFPIPAGYKYAVGVELWSNYSEKTLSELFKKLIYAEVIDLTQHINVICQVKKFIIIGYQDYYLADLAINGLE